MPHLIIESPQPLAGKVVKKLHETVGEQESVSIDAVKTRFYNPDIQFAGPVDGVIHTALTLKLLPGRSAEWKDKVASTLFATARELIPEGSISVEILDLGTYKK